MKSEKRRKQTLDIHAGKELKYSNGSRKMKVFGSVVGLRGYVF
jgi:hypothetical protein